MNDKLKTILLIGVIICIIIGILFLLEKEALATPIPLKLRRQQLARVKVLRKNGAR